MALEIRETLTGKPRPGDRLKITLENGAELGFHYEPHNTYYAYVWRLETKHPDVVSRIESIRTRGPIEVEVSWYAPYLDSKSSIAVGGSLKLIIVPKGFDVMRDDSKIKFGTISGIDINP